GLKRPVPSRTVPWPTAFYAFRERTVRPKTSPYTSSISCPGISFVVAISIRPPPSAQQLLDLRPRPSVQHLLLGQPRPPALSDPELRIRERARRVCVARNREQHTRLTCSPR